mmetsp:Transcript_28747/g.68685  ORF Transcript_28747/g.68685 Transcript_28747/m.68685 type:complete len:320 (+) Transcript_28747:147-1106(+)
MMSWMTLWLRGGGRSPSLSSLSSATAVAGLSSTTRCTTCFAHSSARPSICRLCSAAACTEACGFVAACAASSSSRSSEHRWKCSCRCGCESAIAAAPSAAENPPSSPMGESSVVSMRVMRNGTTTLPSSSIRSRSLLSPGAAPASTTSPCVWLMTRREGVAGATKSARATSTWHAYCTAMCLRKLQRCALVGICARMKSRSTVSGRMSATSFMAAISGSFSVRLSTCAFSANLSATPSGVCPRCARKSSSTSMSEMDLGSSWMRRQRGASPTMGRMCSCMCRRRVCFSFSMHRFISWHSCSVRSSLEEIAVPVASTTKW